MQLDFFPSRTLTLYLARQFIILIAATLGVLVLVLMMLDLLSESGTILAVPGNGQAQILYYVSLRVPQLIARFLPYSVLLATIISLATMNQNSEVVAMKAAGMSAHQVLAPLLLTAALVSVVSFGFNERVVTRANAAFNAWQSNAYSPVPIASNTRNNVYVSDGPNILAADQVTGSGAKTKMTGVTWYQRDNQGLLTEQIRGRSATYAAPGWRLSEVSSFDVQSAETTAAASLIIAPDLTPDQVDLGKVDPDSQNFIQLFYTIRDLEAAGRRTSELWTKWWHRLSGPLSAFLMPLLGAIAAFGLARSGQLFVRAVIGMGLGFAYFVVDNAALAMGNFGGYPPFLAAWGPFLLFLLIGETVLIRTEE